MKETGQTVQGLEQEKQTQGTAEIEETQGADRTRRCQSATDLYGRPVHVFWSFKELE